MATYSWICAGFVQVGSVIIQAKPDYRCRIPLDVELGLSYEDGLIFTPKVSIELF